uniref:RNA binding protein n=1 Tax=Rhizophora mucronata TaxID=61149 RepID=A0A2P2LUM8_RHIMU
MAPAQMQLKMVMSKRVKVFNPRISSLQALFCLVLLCCAPHILAFVHVFIDSAFEYTFLCAVGGPSIYVKGLPLDAMPALLENEFKKFGPIRPGGIQVRSQKGVCFGFVEFDEASAVRSAIEASPVIINGCRVVVEEKRSTSRGNNRGRFSSGGGPGYRSEGARGRGNFGGGKAYSRGDFSSRTESGNRGNSRSGFSNRGGDGYRRDRAANNGGRTNRASGLAFNAAAKNMAPRVSATA